MFEVLRDLKFRLELYLDDLDTRLNYRECGVPGTDGGRCRLLVAKSDPFHHGVDHEENGYTWVVQGER